jgi:hypothetical protein
MKRSRVSPVTDYSTEPPAAGGTVRLLGLRFLVEGMQRMLPRRRRCRKDVLRLSPMSIER